MRDYIIWFIILEFLRVQFCEITVAEAKIVIREITNP
jgi:hypothetical protein